VTQVVFLLYKEWKKFFKFVAPIIKLSHIRECLVAYYVKFVLVFIALCIIYWFLCPIVLLVCLFVCFVVILFSLCDKNKKQKKYSLKVAKLQDWFNPFIDIWLRERKQLFADTFVAKIIKNDKVNTRFVIVNLSE